MKLYLDHKVIKSFKNYVFDCDGVIWQGLHLLPGAKDLLTKLKKCGKRIILLSNNSSIAVEDYVAKCRRLSLDIHADEIVCASAVLANHLKTQNFQGKVYVIGEEGIRKELNKVNIPSLGVGIENRFFTDVLYNSTSYDDEVKSVVVGFDTRFNLTKLTLASGYIVNKKCTFYATNTDSSFPTSTYVVPGTGALVKALTESTGVEPIITGKPSTITFKALQNRYNLDPSESIMIGDNVNTDIKFGNLHGLASLLLFCGVTKFEDFEKIDSKSDKYPTYYCQSLADLVDIF